MKKHIPTIEKTIRPLPEREPYDPLESPNVLYEKRLAERLQELTAQQEEMKVLAKRMKAVSNRANMSSEEYKKSPLAR